MNNEYGTAEDESYVNSTSQTLHHVQHSPTRPPQTTNMKPKDLYLQQQQQQRQQQESQSKRTRQDWQNRIIESENSLRPPQLMKSRNASELSPTISITSTNGTDFSDTGNYYSLPGSRISEISSSISTRADSGSMSANSNESDQSSLTRQSTNSRSIVLPPTPTNNGLPHLLYSNNMNHPVRFMMKIKHLQSINYKLHLNS